MSNADATRCDVLVELGQARRSAGLIRAAHALGVPDSGWLYDHFAPHAGELALGGVGADCGGAADNLLAGLAWRLGRPGEAAERAQADLALETRVGSRIWINRTTELISRINTAPFEPGHRAGDLPDRQPPAARPPRFVIPATAGC